MFNEWMSLFPLMNFFNWRKKLIYICNICPSLGKLDVLINKRVLYIMHIKHLLCAQALFKELQVFSQLNFVQCYKYVLSLPEVSFKKTKVLRDKHVAQIHSLQVMELVFEHRHSGLSVCTKIYLLREGTTILVYRDKEVKITEGD